MWSVTKVKFCEKRFNRNNSTTGNTGIENVTFNVWNTTCVYCHYVSLRKTPSFDWIMNATKSWIQRVTNWARDTKGLKMKN